MADVQVIRTRRQLADFRERHGLRPDWHEPDERGISARFHGPTGGGPGTLDNAHLDPNPYEMGIYLMAEDEEDPPGRRRAAFVNLAVLLALASGEEEVG